MKKLAFLLGLVSASLTANVYAQNASFPLSQNQIKLSVQNGLNSFVQNSRADSVYFLQGGLHSAIQGNYFWNTIGLGARVGYFSNSVDKNSLSEFAQTRKAVPDRSQMVNDSYRGFYLMSGPAFQSSFSKWTIQSNLMAGVFNKPASSISVTERGAQDIVYYKNVFEQSSNLALSAGLSIDYGITRKLNVGVNADYFTTKNDLTNFDMARGAGRVGKQITEQAGFLNTGVKLTYNISSPRDAASGLASGKRQHKPFRSATQSEEGEWAAKNDKNEKQPGDSCNCENKLMDAEEMETHVVEIQFGTVDEAQRFLSTYQPLFEKRDKASGLASGKRQHKPMMNVTQNDEKSIVSNPLYKGETKHQYNPLYGAKDRRTIPNESGSKGMVITKADGQKVFAFLPVDLDIAEVLSFEDGRVTVHVTGKAGNVSKSNRDVATGQSSGRRSYVIVSAGDLDGDGRADFMLRSNNIVHRDIAAKSFEENNDQTWGNYVSAGDVNGDGFNDYILKSNGEENLKLVDGGIMHEDSWDTQQNRDRATGQSSGKRQHKPFFVGDLDGDGQGDWLIATSNHEIKSPRDIATGQSSGKRSKVESFTIKQGIILEADLDGDGEYEAFHTIKSPRDVATGQSSGKRMASKEDVYVWKISRFADMDADGQEDGFIFSKQNSAEANNLSKSFNSRQTKIIIEDAGNAKRDVSTGQSSGRRSYVIVSAGDLDGDGKADFMLRSNNIIHRDIAAKSFTDDTDQTWGSYVSAGDVDGDGFNDYILKSNGEEKLKFVDGGIMHEDSWEQQKRDMATGQSTGKRQHKPYVKTTELGSSGLATGKRTHKPVRMQTNDAGASGLATGKRQHKPYFVGDLDGDGQGDWLIASLNHEIKSPRDVATGQSSGKRSKVESFTIKQSILLEADLDGDGEMEAMYEVKSPKDVASGQSSGKRMASKEDVYVWKISRVGDLDEDGLEDGFIFSKQNSADANNLSKSFTSLQTRVSIGDLNEDGYYESEVSGLKQKDSASKLVEKATSGVKQTMQTQVLMTNQDNNNDDPNLKTVNTTRDNIKRQYVGGAGDDEIGNSQKIVNTSRSNIKNQRNIQCSNGKCTFECEIELDGIIYVATITSRIKTRHDTVKNSIGNIR